MVNNKLRVGEWELILTPDMVKDTLLIKDLYDSKDPKLDDLEEYEFSYFNGKEGFYCSKWDEEHNSYFWKIRFCDWKWERVQ